MTQDRIVLDSNVLVAAAIKPEHAPGMVFSLVLNGTILSYTSEEILGELRTIARREPIRARTQEFGKVVDLFEQHSCVIAPQVCIRACSDPYDDKFLECAVEAGAQAIITGDKALLEMRVFQGIRIMTPHEFFVGKTNL